MSWFTHVYQLKVGREDNYWMHCNEWYEKCLVTIEFSQLLTGRLIYIEGPPSLTWNYGRIDLKSNYMDKLSFVGILHE